jgi:hypothetical protein
MVRARPPVIDVLPGRYERFFGGKFLFHPNTHLLIW